MAYPYPQKDYPRAYQAALTPNSRSRLAACSPKDVTMGSLMGVQFPPNWGFGAQACRSPTSLKWPDSLATMAAVQLRTQAPPPSEPPWAQ